MSRTFIRTVPGALAATLALACSAESPTTPSVRVPELPLLAFIGNAPRTPFRTVRTPQVEFVELCKDYVMTTSATPPTATFTVNGNAVSLINGECREVWVQGGAPVNVTVTENAIPGYLTSFKVTNASGAVTGPTSGYTTTVAPGGNPRAGFLIEYVNVEEVREEGCTLTQGYWKTHSSYGPAPSDDNWNLVGGPDTPFYFSGKSWYQLFWTPPAGGNAYIQLAHQYMAAKLNILSGASTTSAVDAAISAAEAYFNNPANVPNGALTKAQQRTLRGYASTLASFNEGAIGPGHCQD